MSATPLHDFERSVRSGEIHRMAEAQRPWRWAPSCPRTTLARITWLCALVATIEWIPAHQCRAGDGAGDSVEVTTIEVDLKLDVGGRVRGAVVDFNDEAVVFVIASAPHVLAWEEIESGSAYVARRDLLALRRGGTEKLTAEDFLYLGTFCLRHNRTDLAMRSFRQATELDSTAQPRVRELLREYRLRREQEGRSSPPLAAEPQDDDADKRDRIPENKGDPESTGHLAPWGDGALLPPQSDADRQRVIAAYRKFGDSVRASLGREVRLVETEHFMIWTDWEPPTHPRLADWSESMYAALAAQFGFDPHQNVFIGPCPIFCWRSRVMLQRFARAFDDYDAGDSLGYTRSVPGKGHVHVVLARQGEAPKAYERFAWTLVHEGTHAFLHRYHSDRLIPHWVNEGLAELISQRVLQDRCSAAAKADLLAQQYVRYGWPLTGLIHYAGPIDVHQYPLAHSVVAFLESRGRDRLSGFIRGLKDGQSIAEALAMGYDGWTPEDLEAAWRAAIKEGWTVPRR